MAQEIRHLWDRLNYVLGQIDELKEVPRGTSTEQLTQQVGGLQVALQAVQDSLTTGRTFVAFGESQPVGDTTSVAIAGASNGLTFAGTSSALTFTVTGAATFRAAIGAPAAASIVATTLTLAKITGGGADGSLTLSSEGVVTAYVAPT
jgi:hypothetical protein